MASARRVVVTGLGVVGPCGIGRDAFWNGLLSPAPEGDRLVHDFDPTVWLGPKEARRTDRFAQMAIGAAEMALEQSGARRSSSRSSFAPRRARSGCRRSSSR